MCCIRAFKHMCILHHFSALLTMIAFHEVESIIIIIFLYPDHICVVYVVTYMYSVVKEFTGVDNQNNSLLHV